jgi:hypothetical protein
MKDHDSIMDEPVEVAVGVFKPMGECTAKDLRNSARLLEIRAIVQQELAGLFDGLAESKRAQAGSSDAR